MRFQIPRLLDALGPSFIEASAARFDAATLEQRTHEMAGDCVAPADKRSSEAAGR
jgi:hypothetical protein